MQTAIPHTLPPRDLEADRHEFVNTLCCPYVMCSKIVSFIFSPLRHGHQCLIFWIACQLCIGKLESTCRLHPIFGPYLFMNVGYSLTMFLLLMIVVFFVYPPLVSYVRNLYMYASFASNPDTPIERSPRYLKFCFKKKDLLQETSRFDSGASTIYSMTWLFILLIEYLI